MASQPKKLRLLATLRTLAEDELSPDASGLDWVELQVSSGATMREIRDRVVEKWPEVHGEAETASADWMRWQIVETWLDAKERLAAARAPAYRSSGRRAVDATSRQIVATHHWQVETMTLDPKRARLTKTPAGAMAGAPPSEVTEESSELPLQAGVRTHTAGSVPYAS
ncbi:MAG: hypothetical protein ACREOF_06520 [Gemmatimonadales bacterium]